MQFSEAPLLLGLLAAAAAIGFLLGWLIRERPTKVERRRPRLAASTAYLRDAYNRRLSAHSRSKCAFDAIYFCCVELVETQGRSVQAMCHPTRDVTQIGLSAINATEEQLRTADLLAQWVVIASPQLPSVSIDTACKLASWVREQTMTALS
ncbi:hypothetical protein AB4Y45_23115 [Paraburkholderia sp. EG287A]|uniref:hypothetical protein n=1 Tax=Paraburkholderia sp. EG287A TaxID=3237012 RepID=UPI0034D278E1